MKKIWLTIAILLIAISAFATNSNLRKVDGDYFLTSAGLHFFLPTGVPDNSSLVSTTTPGTFPAASVSYTPAIPGDWSPAPSNVSAALDQLAAGGGGGGGGGGYSRTSQTVTAAFTVPTLGGDYILNANTTSGAYSVTLPDAVASSVTIVWCIDVKNKGPNALTVITQSSQTIDNDSSLDLDSGDSFHLCPDSGNWSIY